MGLSSRPASVAAGAWCVGLAPPTPGCPRSRGPLTRVCPALLVAAPARAGTGAAGRQWASQRRNRYRNKSLREHDHSTTVFRHFMHDFINRPNSRLMHSDMTMHYRARQPELKNYSIQSKTREMTSGTLNQEIQLVQSPWPALQRTGKTCDK